MLNSMLPDNKYHLLRLPRNMGHPHRLALGLLYPRRFRIRSKWSANGMDT